MTGKITSQAATWAMFFAGAVISFVAQARSGTRRDLRAFVAHLRWRDFANRSTATDLAMLLIAKPIDKMLGPIFLFCSALLSTYVANGFEHLYPNHAVIPVTFLGCVAISILLFIVLDFMSYVTHYIEHFAPIFWELHKVHHSATTMTPLTIKRTHPVGDLFESGVAALVMTIPLGVLRAMTHMSLLEMAILLSNATLIGTILVLESLKHCPFPISYGPFDKILCSPVMHQVHHGSKIEHWDKNFGNKLMVWDWMFGTLYRAKPGEEMPWGLGKPEEAEYNSLMGAYVLPFRKIVRLIRSGSDGADASQGFWSRVLWRSPEMLPLPVPSATSATADRSGNSAGDKPASVAIGKQESLCPVS
jgi:sterol desaturase/sphingolipid hydroxylase (fatty acid hydroxylase superfamily)